MEFKIYDGIMDLNLIEQMRKLFLTLSGAKNRWNLIAGAIRRSPFRRIDEELASMEEEYGLRYPGEVLERYENKIGDTEVVKRSLAFALAEMKPLFEKTMFTGKQLENFLTSIRKDAESDVYMLGACYILEDFQPKKMELRAKVMEHNCQNISELLYCYYLLYDEASFQKAHYAELAEFLANKRDFSIYGNEELYAWVIRFFSDDLKNMKGNGTNLLRAIVKLNRINVETKNPVKSWLQDSGYQEDEIIYLNMLMAIDHKLPGPYPSDITLERMAVSVCTRFLNGSTQRPKEVYDLCSRLLEMYRKYPVKIGGSSGLAESLKSKVNIQTIGAYMALFPYRTILEHECFYIKILDHKWDALKELLGQEYEMYVVDSLTMLPLSAEELQKSIERYRELTGIDLYQRLWDGKPYSFRMLFNRIADYNLLDVASMAGDYIMERKRADTETAMQNFQEKWKNMREHMWYFLSQKKDERLYSVLQMVEEQFGIENFNSVFDSKGLFESCFGIEGYNGFNYMKLFQKDFSLEKNLQLLHLAEKYIYYNNPSQYKDFLAKALLHLDCGEYPDKSLSDIAKQLLFLMSEREQSRESLIRKYYSDEELAEYNVEKARAAMQVEEEKRIREAEEQKNQFDIFVAEHEKELPYAFYDFLLSARYYDERGLSGFVADYIRKEYDRGPIVISESKVGFCLKLFANLYQWDRFSIADIKEFVQRLEVCDDV